MLGPKFLAIAEVTKEGLCTICGGSACDHETGLEYLTVATSRMVDPVLNEVSLTPRPRDPLARIQQISVDPAEIAHELGELPQPDVQLRHWGCTYFCPGLVETEELVKPYRPKAT